MQIEKEKNDLFFSGYSIEQKRHFFLSDSRLWIKHQRMATRTHLRKSHQMAHPRTYTLTQTFLTNQIKNRACREEEWFANWSEQPRRKGFKYHWKWGQCDCITSGSAELLRCLWWPRNSISQIICIMSQITLHVRSALSSRVIKSIYA